MIKESAYFHLFSIFRNAGQSNSADHNRAMESISLYENLTDTFHDLYDAIEKLDIDSLNKSESSSAPLKSIPGPSLGDLLQLNIS